MSTDKNLSFAARLDKLVNWTHIPDLANMTVRRRHLRFFPILVLLAGTLGLSIVLLLSDRYWSGYVLLLISFAVSNLLPLLGPVKRQVNPAEDLDEREKAVSKDAYRLTFAAISLTAIAGIWVLVGLATMNDWSRVTLTRAMTASSFYLLLLLTTLPTLFASWTVPKPVDEDE